MTVPMALMDFVPVLLFGAAWVVLYKDLKNKLDLCAGLLLPLGAATVFAAGLFKAIWKLQNAVGASPVVLGNLGMSAGLVYIARKVNRSAVPLFILSFVLILMMGYLSSRDFAQASMHWVAQSVNLLGEGLLFIGALLLHRAGLAAPDVLSGRA